jgi:hypothetical protein
MKPFKTKSATRNAIYKIASPLTKGFFTDSSWENVSRIWKALEAEGAVLNLSKAIYGSPDICKTWYFDADVNGFAFKGYLVASFCGTVSDPTSLYDLCFVIS